MTSAAWALQQSVYQRLRANTGLTGMLGGEDIFDDVPRSASFPYLTLGQSMVRDWSAGGDDGHEHILTLHVWSRANGRKEVYEIMGVLKDVLHDQHVSLVDHQLVNLRHEFSEARRDPDGETYHGIVRFRAITEPA